MSMGMVGAGLPAIAIGTGIEQSLSPVVSKPARAASCLYVMGHNAYGYGGGNHQNHQSQEDWASQNFDHVVVPNGTK